MRRAGAAALLAVLTAALALSFCGARAAAPRPAYIQHAWVDRSDEGYVLGLTVWACDRWEHPRTVIADTVIHRILERPTREHERRHRVSFERIGCQAVVDSAHSARFEARFEAEAFCAESATSVAVGLFTTRAAADSSMAFRLSTFYPSARLSFGQALALIQDCAPA